MKQHQTMRIEKDIIQSLKKQAKKERRSLNNLIENVLSDFSESLKNPIVSIQESGSLLKTIPCKKK